VLDVLRAKRNQRWRRNFKLRKIYNQTTASCFSKQ